MDDKLRNHDTKVDGFRTQIQQDKKKNKERFQKVNEALVTLEKYLDAGNRKIDKVVNSEIQAR